MRPIIDAHIHFDQYDQEEQDAILHDMEKDNIEAFIAVSTDASSAHQTLQLAHIDARVKPAIGYHPEQPLPTDAEANALLEMLRSNHKEIVAIGEVGLPYYTRQRDPALCVEPYMDLLECLIKEARELNKPIALHAIYEDADLVCDALEKHSVQAAHFHWFKGSVKTIDRMSHNGYMISVTPDCIYEPEIQTLIKRYPLEQIMVETDGPWPFEGPFSDQRTHPHMMHHSIHMIAKLKQLPIDTVYTQIYYNTTQFYHLFK